MPDLKTEVKTSVSAVLYDKDGKVKAVLCERCGKVHPPGACPEPKH